MPTPPLRRAPVQRRSAERLDRILDACARLLEEVGYEALSTRAVAERAAVPIGSVYRFFPNKRAMAEALAHRNLDEYSARVEDRLAALDAAAAPGPSGPDRRRSLDWRQAVEVVVEEYLAMKRGAPGFALVEFGAPLPGAAARERPNDLVVDRLIGLLGERLGLADGGRPRPPDGADACPGPPAPERLRLVLLIAVEAADAVLRLAFRADPQGDPEIVAEAKELLRRYLEPVLG
ncbi:TetR/AcrR family transcriptional regulator [Streptomyces sp. B1866]|uniref:TetR/AcrR family transcriptional regulator n=1 Tax=Streptomyces sp. B1866 TaxID=3075431 RepID=UPI00288C9849|nr:TetR/AcrR family transcriptional regulator [Streptomyces sp. B1866]MDT3397497.1 TetR/AcrR family transcriptional regulator [Streptomyces sp. B1866]